MDDSVTLLDAAQFLQEFFSDVVPSDIQDICREAFVIKYKVDPEVDPRGFSSYVAKYCSDDPVLRNALLSAHAKVTTKGRRKEAAAAVNENEASTVEMSSVSREGKIEQKRYMENKEARGIIFSSQIGLDPTLRVLKEAKENSSKTWSISMTLGGRHHPSTDSRDLTNFASLQIETRQYASDMTVQDEVEGDEAVVRTDVTSMGGDPSSERYLFLHVENEGRSDALNTRAQQLCNRMIEYYQSEWVDSEGGRLPIVGVGGTHQNPAIIIGRVLCDCEGPINEQSALLEGTRDLSRGRIAQLHLRAVPQLVLYPGQIIALKGIGEKDELGATFSATALYSGIPPHPPSLLLKEMIQCSENFKGQEVDVCIVSGPFTNANSLNYIIFDALLQKLQKNPPHVLILLGPFVDFANSLVNSGDLQILSETDGEMQWIGFDDIYAKIGEQIASSIPSQTKVFLVPSTNDVCHPFPIPQPPFPSNLFYPHQTTPAKLSFLSNPVCLTLNGFKMAIFAGDPVSQIARNAASRNNPGNKFDLFCAELLKQQTFFPVLPSPYPLEPSRLISTLFDPHDLPSILLFSSDKFPPAAKIVETHHIAINCGRLQSQGNPFVHLYLSPASTELQEKWINICAGDDCQREAVDVANRCAVEIFRNI